MTINNSRDLRIAYQTLELIKDFFDKASDKAKAEKHMQDIKQAIRAYNRRKSDRRYIKGDFDGYIELIEVPQDITDIEDVEAWFEECERLYCMPSQYDCTGQSFTVSHKAVNRGGKWFMYHEVGFDV